MDSIESEASSPRSRRPAWFCRLSDVGVTLFLWGYFTVGFVLFFAPFYLLTFIFASNRPAAYQYLNYLFFKIFFVICRGLAPSHRWRIDPQVEQIRASMVVCNHISYLDSILLISLFPRHTTIAKDRLFRIPVFRQVLALSGYIPSSGGGRYADLLLKSLETIAARLAAGGNIIIFPEGTRSRDGRVGSLHKGAFKIARYCKAPIKVLKVSNTDKLFRPGKFLFNTCTDNTIGLKFIAELTPDYESHTFSMAELMTQVRALLEGHSIDTDHQPE